MIIRKYEIGSDDDTITVEQIKSLPIVDSMTVDFRITRENDESKFWTAVFDAGYDVFMDTDNEIIYIIHD